MYTLNVPQGSTEWIAARRDYDCASEAAAMLGYDKKTSRNELMRMKATGGEKEFSDWVRKNLLDKGHEIEAAARPFAEVIVGDLYPQVGVLGIGSLRLLASFDGLTSDDSIAWECKSSNAALIAAIEGGDLPDSHWPQVEQQLLISEAEYVLFTVSDGTEDGSIHFKYTAKPERRAQLIAGWEQFNLDLAEYTPSEIIPAAVAAPQPTLPAVFVQVSGDVSVRDNLTSFGGALKAYVERINKKPETDEDFATLEATVKTLKTAEEALDAAESGALAQTGSIDLMRRMVAEYRDLARANRLTAEKVVKAEKENRRNAITQKGKDAFAAHVAALNARLGKPYMPGVYADFTNAVKGLKTIASIQNAVDTELARAKIEANAIADKIDANLRSLRDMAKDHAFLFSDTPSIISKANDDLVALIKSRIAEHVADEAKKTEELRAKIAEEERAKAEAKAKIEQASPALPLPTVALVPAEKVVTIVDNDDAVPATTPSTSPTLTLGKIGARLGFSLTADFLRSIGFEPAGRERSAVLYHDSQWQAICTALIAHIQNARLPQQVAA